MLKILLGFALSSAQAAATLPDIQDHQFAPAVWSALYSNSDARYDSLVQFTGSDSANVVGRYCKLDQRHQPFECISIKPDASKRTCAITSYNEKDFKIPAIQLDPPNVDNILFSSRVDDQSQRQVVSRILPLIGFSNKGSSRRLSLPVATEISSGQEKAKINEQYRTELAQGNVHAELLKYSRTACNDFFRFHGAAERFESARTTNRARCVAYNLSIDRMIAGEVERKNIKKANELRADKRDCATFEGQSGSATTTRERSMRPKIKINLNPFKAVQ